MAITIILLIGVLYASVWTVMTTRLIRAVVGLAVTSAMLSIVMFRFNSSLAAVFELSVCAGLIFVIFITTVSFTARLSQEEYQQRKKERLVKFRFLPIIIIIAAVLLFRFTGPSYFISVLNPFLADTDVRSVLWNKRSIDLFGQIAALLAAAVGVVVLFKERKK